MRLLTLNCHSFMEENYEEKILETVKVIAKNDYDVIAFQEASQSIDSLIEYDNLRNDNYALRIQKELKKLNKDYNLFWDYSHIGYDRFEEGLAILTKKEMISKESFFVSKIKDKSYWKTRKILKVTIKEENELIDIYSCHLGWFKDEEESSKYQIDEIMKKIDKNRISILMGDFNSEAYVENEGYDYLTKEYSLFDTFSLAENKDSGITVIGKIDGWESTVDKRIDLILSNKKIKVIESKVIFNGKNEAVVSDHFGLDVVCNLN